LHADLDKAFRAAGYDNLNDYVVDVVSRAQKAGEWPAAAPGQEQERLPMGGLPIGA
jgi:hypothetical protein